MDDVQGEAVLAELKALRKQVAELEEQVAGDPPSKGRSTRRGMLRLAGAAVVGGAASLISAETAAAADIEMGVNQSSGAVGTGVSSTTNGIVFQANNVGGGGGTGLWGDSTGSGNGVVGKITSPSASGYGVWAQVTGGLGYPLVATGGSAQLLLQLNAGSGPPESGVHQEGELLSNPAGVFYCVEGGVGGKWRKLASLSTAGAFHAITPTRVYDSRAVDPVGNVGLLLTGTNRTISVADKRNSVGAVTAFNIVPAGATAVAANITVTGTTGAFGYLSVNPGGVTTADASAINWFGAGQTLANGVSLTLNTIRQLTVVCGAGGGNTHFIVDISGYYL